MNPKMYSIEFSPSELEQLLKVLYEQTVLQDEAAIRLIAKINAELKAKEIEAIQDIECDAVKFVSYSPSSKNNGKNYIVDINLGKRKELDSRYTF